MFNAIQCSHNPSNLPTPQFLGYTICISIVSVCVMLMCDVWAHAGRSVCGG